MFGRYFNIAIIIVALFTSAGCSDFLQPKVYNRLTGYEFPKTEQDVDALVTSVYYQFRNGAWGRYNSDNNSLIVLGLLGTDEFTCQWSGFWDSPFNFTWRPDEFPFSDFFYQMVPSVTVATSVLYQLHRFQDVLPKEKFDRYVSEVHVARAIMMFDLYKLYGPLSLITDEKDIPVLESVPYRPRPTSKEMVELIEADLTDDIISALEVQYADSEFGRLTQGAARMCLLKLYLHEKNYPKVEEQARKIMALNVYGLQSDYKSIWSINNERNDEIIWALVCQPSPEGIENNMRAHIIPSDWKSPNGYPSEGWNGYKVPWPFYDRFDLEDTRMECLVRYYTNTLDKTVDARENCYGALPLKYSEDPAGTAVEQGVDYVIYRYADVLLALAEALNEQNGPVQEAVDLINQVRDRAFKNNPAKRIKLGDFADKDALRDYILDERGFELYFEGFRREDLIRHGKYIEYANDPERMGREGSGSRPINPQQNAREYHVLYPIPNQVIVDSDGVLKQNEGYN